MFTVSVRHAIGNGKYIYYDIGCEYFTEALDCAYYYMSSWDDVFIYLTETCYLIAWSDEIAGCMVMG